MDSDFISFIGLISLQLFIAIFVLAVLIDAFIFFRKYPKKFRKMEVQLETIEKYLCEQSKYMKKLERIVSANADYADAESK